MNAGLTLQGIHGEGRIHPNAPTLSDSILSFASQLVVAPHSKDTAFLIPRIDRVHRSSIRRINDEYRLDGSRTTLLGSNRLRKRTIIRTRHLLLNRLIDRRSRHSCLRNSTAMTLSTSSGPVPLLHGRCWMCSISQNLIEMGEINARLRSSRG